METFSGLLAIFAGNSRVPGEFPTQRPVSRSFDVFFDLHPNKRLSKQPWGWWFETLSWSLWRQGNAHGPITKPVTYVVDKYSRAHIYQHIPAKQQWSLGSAIAHTAADSRMMTSSNGNIFRVTDPFCGEFTGHRPVTRSLDAFIDLCLNKQLGKQSWGWCFETPSRSLWRHCYGTHFTYTT